MYVNI
jgi:uncharacterized membrane protein YukC